ncbi:LuxR C-terminal-related transcriptional regulator [Amycolatopsis sp. NBC_00345]|uniref:helix-turn-helix transcriptional regulator n=1 Tax=Amycolatopsis sp. NBC_00345 TaxID=2975955 RepID=UPI002E269795
MARRDGNLPMTTTSFVGRGRELREARRVLRDERLVTLVGTGGVGKTRLATELGATVARDFPGGVWLVDLAARSPGADIADAVSAVLPFRPGGGIRALAEYLDRPSTLLILDNCEHRLDECGPFATGLLRRTSGTRILTTSRESLGVLGENVLEVPDLKGYDAMELFAGRARSILPGFSVAPGSAPAVAKICSRLDGVPLAIELAATRLRTQSLAELSTALEDRRRLLGLGSRTAPFRHRSLGHLSASSYELCTRRERELWARLSVFDGTFDLAGAEAVCDGDGIAREDVLRLIAGLVRKSVVTRVEDEGETGYRLINTVRQYGVDRLLEKGCCEFYRERHARHFSAAGRRWESTLDSLAFRTQADPELTRREQEVAKLVRAGLTNQAIGETLGISKRTAESHIARIMSKLGFGRRTQISAWVAKEYPGSRR